MLAASAAMLATRFLLLLVLAGAFSLAVMAMEEPSVVRIFVLVAYSLLVVLPMVGLEIRSKWEG